MKKILALCALFSGGAFAGCNFANGEALTISDFEYMNKAEVAKYFCSSMSIAKMYTLLANDFKDSMPDKSKDYSKGSGMCRVELKRASMVLAKKHGISEVQLNQMQTIMTSQGKGDNIQRCVAVTK